MPQLTLKPVEKSFVKVAAHSFEPIEISWLRIVDIDSCRVLLMLHMNSASHPIMEFSETKYHNWALMFFRGLYNLVANEPKIAQGGSSAL